VVWATAWAAHQPQISTRGSMPPSCSEMPASKQKLQQTGFWSGMETPRPGMYRDHSRQVVERVARWVSETILAA
jgi:hypothetical protein